MLRDGENWLINGSLDPTSSLLASHWLYRGGNAPRANFPLSAERKQSTIRHVHHSIVMHLGFIFASIRLDPVSFLSKEEKAYCYRLSSFFTQHSDLNNYVLESVPQRYLYHLRCVIRITQTRFLCCSLLFCVVLISSWYDK